MNQFNSFLIVLLCLFISCSQLDKKDIIIKKYHSFNSTEEKYDLSNKDVLRAKKISNIYIDSLEKIQKKNGFTFRTLNYKLSEYYRQYYGYKNKDGEIIVYIKAYCISNTNLNDLDAETVINGGGSCYYDITVNLSKGFCFQYRINGGP